MTGVLIGLLLLIGCMLCVAGLWQHWAGIPPWRLPRTVPRPRTRVGKRIYSLARCCGFRYSYERDALVLRFVGRRWGPVLKRADRFPPPLTPPSTKPLRPPPSRRVRGRKARGANATVSARAERHTAARAAGARDAARGASDAGGSGSDAGGSAGEVDGNASDVGGSGSEAGRSASDVGGSASEAGRSASDVGGSASEAGRSASDVGGSASEAGRSASDVGGSASEAGRSASDVGGSGSDATSRTQDALLRAAGVPIVAAHARNCTDRVVDVACLKLPHTHRGQELWQLIAVDVDARFVWAELKRTRSGPPSPQDATGFVRRLAADLDTRGLRLSAIVVRNDGGSQRSIFDAAAGGGVRLMRVPPASRHERVAAHTHGRIVSVYWRDAFAADRGRSLSALRRGLRTWVDAHNDSPPSYDPTAPPPATALVAQPDVPAAPTGRSAGRA